MNTRLYIAGTMIAVFGAMIFSPQAIAEGRRGHQGARQHGNHDYNRGGHHYQPTRHASHYRAHRNEHIIGAAAIVIGGLIHHNQHKRYAGHYESRQVLVRAGYYEKYQVHTPAEYDHHGVLIERAHHHTRSRWIEPIYRTEQVWVPRY